jgi:hypothetical protein
MINEFLAFTAFNISMIGILCLVKLIFTQMKGGSEKW